MQRVFGFIGHLISAMLKGFFFAGVAAAILCAVVLFVTEPNHQVQLDTSMIFGMNYRAAGGRHRCGGGADLSSQPPRRPASHDAPL